jgi:hypothetical protein
LWLGAARNPTSSSDRTAAEKTTVSAKHFVINRLASRNGNIAKHIGF